MKRHPLIFLILLAPWALFPVVVVTLYVFGGIRMSDHLLLRALVSCGVAMVLLSLYGVWVEEHK